MATTGAFVAYTGHRWKELPAYRQLPSLRSHVALLWTSEATFRYSVTRDKYSKREQPVPVYKRQRLFRAAQRRAWASGPTAANYATSG
jgi:hypothetical protein